MNPQPVASLALAPTSDFFLGLDLGQAADYTALAVVERSWDLEMKVPCWYACRYLSRWHLGTPYPVIVENVGKMLSKPPLQGAPLVIDGTGVGKAVVDMFRHDWSLVGGIVPITITARQGADNTDACGWHVAKIQLVSTLQMLMQTKRLKVASSLPLARILIQELSTFKVKITLAGNETFEAWRERDHDDMVLALAVAVWYAEKHPPFMFSDVPLAIPNQPREGFAKRWERLGSGRLFR